MDFDERNELKDVLLELTNTRTRIAELRTLIVRPGETTVIMGKPKSGKSLFLWHMLQAIDYPVICVEEIDILNQHTISELRALAQVKHQAALVTVTTCRNVNTLSSEMVRIASVVAVADMAIAIRNEVQFHLFKNRTKNKCFFGELTYTPESIAAANRIGDACHWCHHMVPGRKVEVVPEGENLSFKRV